MSITNNRNYNCKDEELPVICNFVSFSFRRDLADFTAYSSNITTAYADGFDAKIDAVTEVVNPKSETLEMKRITDLLYTFLDKMINQLNRLEGYLLLAHSTLNLTPADLGISNLRKGLRSRNTELVLKSMGGLLQTLETHKTELSAAGMTGAFLAEVKDSLAQTSQLKQQQYQMLSNRKVLVQANLALFNELNNQLIEILAIGKILYKGTDAVKNGEYTFSNLKKRLRAAEKEAVEPAASVNVTPNS